MSEREPLRISRRTALKWGALAAASPTLGALPLDVFASGDSVVLVWNEAALQGVRDSKLGPPMVARALAIVHTCIFDAWAAYDHRAVGTRFGGALRRPTILWMCDRAPSSTRQPSTTRIGGSRYATSTRQAPSSPNPSSAPNGSTSRRSHLRTSPSYDRRPGRPGTAP